MDVKCVSSLKSFHISRERETSLICGWILFIYVRTKPNPGPSETLSRLSLWNCLHVELWTITQQHTEPSGSQSLSIQVHFLEESLPKLIGAYHDGTGRGHLDHPGHETWRKDQVLLNTSYRGERSALAFHLIKSTNSKVKGKIWRNIKKKTKYKYLEIVFR